MSIFLLMGLALFSSAQTRTDFKPLAESIFASLQKKDYAKVVSNFDSTFKKRLDEKKLEQMWANVYGLAGAFVKTKEVKQESSQPMSIAVTLTLMFDKKTINLRMIFGRDDKIKSFTFLPYHPVEKYKVPSYYDSTKVKESDIRFNSGEYNLPGTLSLPASGKQLPAVILVHGTGPNDRDETVGATKLFKDIALGLAMKGVAVLRYDKRAKAYAGKRDLRKKDFTVRDEAIDDVIAATEAIKKYSSVDTTKIFLLGHGFGAMILPRIAKELPQLAGIIMVGANTNPLEDEIYEQAENLFSQDSMTSRKTQLLDSLKIQVNKVKHLTSADSSSSPLLFHPKSYWLDMNSYHQVEVAKNLSLPILIIQGERDYQVPIENFNTWKKELGDKKNVKLKLYPKLNHLLQEGSGESTASEYDKQGNVPSYVISDLYNWISPKK
jgi:dienelactone hydrolase